MRLIAYDFEALVRTAQQAPFKDGMVELRAWAADVRAAARPETGFGREDEGTRVFDASAVDAVLARLERSFERLGGEKALRDLLGDFPGRTIGPAYDGWALYEDLVRLWTVMVSKPWTDAQILAADGAGSLLGPLGSAIDKDLRLAPYSPFCEAIGKPYPITWRDKPRARIYHVSQEYLDALCEVGAAEVKRASATANRTPDEIAAAVGGLIRHCELARQLDTVVAVDPDDAFWARPA